MVSNVLERVAADIEPVLRASNRLLPGEHTPTVLRTNDGASHLMFGGAQVRLREDTLSLTFETGEERCVTCPDPKWLFEQAKACILTGRTTEEFPVGVGLHKYFCPLPNNGVDRDWWFIARDILHNEEGDEVWDFEAPYQRPYVWSETQQEEFIGHVLSGGTVPLIYIHEEWVGERVAIEVVDGKQRLNAILRFMSGQLPARMLDGSRFYYGELNERERRHRAMSSRVVTLHGMTLRERMRFYLRLNDSGVRHTKADLNKVKELLNDY